VGVQIPKLRPLADWLKMKNAHAPAYGAIVFLVRLRAGSKVQIELRAPEPSRLMPEIPDDTLAAVAHEESGKPEITTREHAPLPASLGRKEIVSLNGHHRRRPRTV
jgi:hypothetical protein